VLEFATNEHSKGTKAEAPGTRPCKLTYSGNIGSIDDAANNTADSLKARTRNDIDAAEMFK
jgi:hypothetical protein